MALARAQYEYRRDGHHANVCLCFLMAIGLCGTCAVRESIDQHVHAAYASLAVGTAVLLAIRVARTRRAAYRLLLVTLCTGTAQALSMQKVMHLPSPVLGLAEIGLCVLFNGTVFQTRAVRKRVQFQWQTRLPLLKHKQL